MAKKKKGNAPDSKDSGGGSVADPMTQCVALCQEDRWREAVLLCRQVLEKAKKNGNDEVVESLGGALAKLEFSLRRQMAAALVGGAKELLAEEFLLDVGK